MGDIVLKCNKCGRFYIGGEDKDINCIDHYKNCGGTMYDTGIKFEEANIIRKISSDNYFLQAMINLKEKDIIEYNLKLSQFKSQLEQQESNRTQNDATPSCPNCKSTNIKPISALNRGVSIAVLGVFSKKINKSYECKNCGYTW